MPLITPLYAALAATILIVLSLRVITAHSGKGRLFGMTLTFFVLAAGGLGTLKVALGAAFL